MSLNAEVAELFEEYADLLEAQGDEYRPRSYRRAADNIREYPTAVETLVAEDPAKLQDIEGVGESIAGKVQEFVETGSIDRLVEAREELPVDMAALTSVEGVGPKTVGDLYEQLGITTLDDLAAAARAGEIRELNGYGPKTESNILEGISFARQASKRELLVDARRVADDLLGHLRESAVVESCDVAGSLRRWRETVGDIDILAAGDDSDAIVDRFITWDGTDEELEAGSAKASIRGRGMRIDLRVVQTDEWGSALQYFTGSKDHNIRLRNWAIDTELKVNEYGVFDVSAIEDPDAGQRVGTRLAGASEASVYQALDLEWIPPELREDQGEIHAAATNGLPTLIEEGDLRGDLHVHTDSSDGNASLAEMVSQAAAFGHDYLGIADHATGPGVVSGIGLSDTALLEQAEVIREESQDHSIAVFAGVEANITAEGDISVSDDVLAELDLVVASPHSALDGDGTDRIVAAISHPEVDIIGHPSGRLLNQRPGLTLDIARVAEAAAAHETALEINANPHRLDLWGSAVRTAIDAGARVVINTDAHHPREYRLQRFGIHTARRGWASSDAVLNADSLTGLQSYIT